MSSGIIISCTSHCTYRARKTYCRKMRDLGCNLMYSLPFNLAFIAIRYAQAAMDLRCYDCNGTIGLESSLNCDTVSPNKSAISQISFYGCLTTIVDDNVRK